MLDLACAVGWLFVALIGSLGVVIAASRLARCLNALNAFAAWFAYVAYLEPRFAGGSTRSLLSFAAITVMAVGLVAYLRLTAPKRRHE